MNAARIVALVAGVAILALNAMSVIMVLIVPRSGSSLVTYPMRGVRAVFRRLAGLARSYPASDRILAVSEPVALVSLLVTWLVVTIAGFTLVNYGVDGAGASHAFSEAGSSVFTLGFTLGHAERLAGGRLHRRRHRARAGGPPDRLPAHPLRRLQPSRDAGHPAREPGRLTGLGARAPHPPPAGRR